jgi:membrane protein
VTVVLWAVAIVGFSVYLKISNVGRLYGALSTLIVFLLWLYVLMIGFIVGVILNSEKVLQQDKKKKRQIKKRKRGILFL